MHANYRLSLQLGGVKKGDLPEPLRVPRPGNRAEQSKPKKATRAEFAGWVQNRTRGA